MCRAFGAITLGLVLAVSASAAEPRPATLDELGGKRINIERAAVDVALADADRNRVETWTAETRSHPRLSVVTGPAWAKGFRGDPHNAPTFTIVSSSVFETSVAAGSSTRVTYVVEGTLAFGGRDYLIHAQGSETTGRSSTHAVPAAVGKCVVDAARKVSKIISAGPDAS
jgi:hypothetical protein